MKCDSVKRPIVAFALGLTITAAAANVAKAQQAPRSDTTAAEHKTSPLRTIVEFLLPEIGMVVGQATGGANGAFTGAVVGTVIGGTMAFLDARAASVANSHGQLCLVPGSAATPDIVIPGAPPTPPIGDMPGFPGTPDITVPGIPATLEHWEVCR